MLQQLWLRLQLFFIEARHCLGQIFGTNFGQIVVVEPLAGIQGAPGTAGNAMKPEQVQGS